MRDLECYPDQNSNVVIFEDNGDIGQKVAAHFACANQFRTKSFHSKSDGLIERRNRKPGVIGIKRRVNEPTKQVSPSAQRTCRCPPHDIFRNVHHLRIGRKDFLPVEPTSCPFLILGKPRFA
jgi:hypothetical protein